MCWHINPSAESGRAEDEEDHGEDGVNRVVAAAVDVRVVVADRADPREAEATYEAADEDELAAARGADLLRGVVEVHHTLHDGHREGGVADDEPREVVAGRVVPRVGDRGELRQRRAFSAVDAQRVRRQDGDALREKEGAIVRTAITNAICSELHVQRSSRLQERR